MKEKIKTIVIGKPQVETGLKPITVRAYLYTTGESVEHASNIYSALQFNFVELICRNYSKGTDLMFAYNDPNKRSEGTLYIGEWNDGVIEHE
jgi:hypothetical protein